MGPAAFTCRVVTDLALLKTLTSSQLTALCQSCAEMMLAEKQQHKLRRTVSKSAASYKWNTQQLERALFGLSKVFFDSAKADAIETDLQASLAECALEKEQLTVIIQCYMKYKSQFAEIVKKPMSSRNLPQYQDLQWRFDIQLETRYNTQPRAPILLLNLETKGPESLVSQKTVFQTDYQQLKAMDAKLEEALQALDSTAYDRIERYIS